MQKSAFLPLLLLLSVCSFPAKAQLADKQFQAEFEGIGKVILEFKPGAYSLSNSQGIELVHGDYTISDETITVNDTGGMMACDQDVSGKYHVSYKEDVLILELLEDGCSGRASVVESSWEPVDP